MKNKLARLLTVVAAGAVIFAIAGAAPASADDHRDRHGRWDNRYSHDRRDRDRSRSDFRIDLNFGGYSRPHSYSYYDPYVYSSYGYTGGYGDHYYRRHRDDCR